MKCFYVEPEESCSNCRKKGEGVNCGEKEYAKISGGLRRRQNVAPRLEPANSSLERFIPSLEEFFKNDGMRSLEGVHEILSINQISNSTNSQVKADK